LLGGWWSVRLAIRCVVLRDGENVMYVREMSETTNVYLCSVDDTPFARCFILLQPDVKLTEVARRIALESRGNHVLRSHSLTPLLMMP
jgi:hypothetical protein